MNIVRIAFCAATLFALAASVGSNAQDGTCDKNHYILSYPLGSWVATGNLNVSRSGHTATLLPDGKVLVAGGRGPSPDETTFGAALDSAELYDPATGSWAVTGSLTRPRTGHTATLLPNGKVLVVAGDGFSFVVAGEELNSDLAGSAELYDPATGVWTPTGSLNTPRLAFTATLLATGEVLVAGGVDSADNSLASAELYDPSTGTWSFTGNLVSPRLLHTATALTDGRALVVGGWNDDFVQLSIATAELYDPVAGTWSSAARLNQARSFHSATRLEDGKVLVAGGYQSRPLPSGYRIPTSLAGVELFDPIAGTWTLVGDLSEPREGHTATLLPDGEVLVAGGNDWNVRGGVMGTESYEVATATWVNAGSLGSTRVGHTATLLLDGRVLVAGGQSSNVPLGSAEIYSSSACQ